LRSSGRNRGRDPGRGRDRRTALQELSSAGWLHVVPPGTLCTRRCSARHAVPDELERYEFKNIEFSKSRVSARCEHLAIARRVRRGLGCTPKGGVHVVSEQASRTLDALRADGRRVTTARRLVVELLARTSEHLSADDLALRI